MMKRALLILVLSLSFVGFSQSSHYNTKKGFAAEGYDVVAYFNGAAKKGDVQYAVTHEGIKYKFSTQENLNAFNSNPDAYKPQYGGFCAYAVAVSGKKVSVNPETFEIRDGNLYLFYNSGKNNTLESWKKESPDALRKKADANWEKIKSK